MWFNQPTLRGILQRNEGGRKKGQEEEEGEAGEEEEVERMVKAYKDKGGQLWERGKERRKGEAKVEEIEDDSKGVLLEFITFFMCN